MPGSDNSGGKTRHKRSKDGSRYLKLALHHAAVRPIQSFPEIQQAYWRLARRKGKPIARALIAKELATIAYAVLTKGEPFNGRFLRTRPEPPEAAPVAPAGEPAPSN